MENFKLTNLRELSTEEQLQLNGGVYSTGCNCNVTCKCEDDTPKSTVNDNAKSVGKKLSESLS